MELAIKDRHAKLLELLPKHKYHVRPAAIEAGFSETTANKRGKYLLQSALKRQAKQLEQRKIDMAKNKDKSSQELIQEMKSITMAERIGLSREEVMENIRWLATQERDLATRLKVVKAIAKEFQVDLGEDEGNKTIVPVLNVTVRERNTAQPSHIIEGTTLPTLDGSDNADCANLPDEGDTGVGMQPGDSSE